MQQQNLLHGNTAHGQEHAHKEYRQRQGEERGNYKVAKLDIEKLNQKSEQEQENDISR